DPDTCAVFALYRLFTDEQQQQALADRYRAGGMGYGEAKQTLYEAAMEYFGPAFERRAQLEQTPEVVEQVLQEGAQRARERAKAVVERVRVSCGLNAR
ncbi:MAG: tryptophan--tRNA ligase, partial [Planctomycetaceae bacterium]|nr:tryptophan--tRNA ligase [Planctomycetaceae bacterium]